MDLGRHLRGIANSLGRRAPPHLSDGVGGEDGVWMTQVISAIGECGIERVYRHQSSIYDNSAKRLDGRRQVIDHGMSRRDAEQEGPVLHLIKTSVARQRKEPLSQADVGAHGRKRAFERCFQTIPGRMRRIAIERRHIGLLQGNGSAWSSQSGCFSQQRFGIAGRTGHKAYVNEIEAATWQVCLVGIADYEFDIAGSTLARVMEENRIGIEADDAAGFANALAQEVGNSAGPTTEIETGPTRSHADAIQHDRAFGGHGRPLNVQALNLPLTGLDRILAGICRGHPRGPDNGG
jgi:hypothetical protein